MFFRKKDEGSKEKKKKRAKKVDVDYDEIIQKGGVRVRIIIEIVGKPLEHVNEVLDEMKQRIKKEYIIKSVKKFRPKKIENIFQGFLELDAYFRNIDEVIHFLFTYYPSSFELIEPGDFHLEITDFNSIFNDVLLKVHALGLQLKNAVAENTILKEDINKLLRERELLMENLLSSVLYFSNKPLSESELSKLTGLQGNLKLLLENLIKKGKIKRVNDKYLHVKNE